MKKVILTLLLSLSLYNYQVNYEAPSIYCVMDANSNEVLEGSNIHKKRSVASISKIMTAIIVIEKGNLFDVIIVDEIIKTIEGSAIYVEENDEISVMDLLYGLMLRSGNDAAVILAKYTYGSVNDFVIKMNEKAMEIGMNNTIFNNPTGLDIFDEGNISTSYDMCLLMSYCMNNDIFFDIAKTKYYSSKLKGRWKNKNKLLFITNENVIGKTGYTKKAKRTFISGLKRGDERIAICTLNYGDDFSFHKRKYDEYISSYYYIVCLYKGDNYIGEYIIYSDKIIGKRIRKNETNRIVILYQIDEKGNVIVEIKKDA